MAMDWATADAGYVGLAAVCVCISTSRQAGSQKAEPTSDSTIYRPRLTRPVHHITGVLSETTVD